MRLTPVEGPVFEGALAVSASGLDHPRNIVLAPQLPDGRYVLPPNWFEKLDYRIEQLRRDQLSGCTLVYTLVFGWPAAEGVRVETLVDGSCDDVAIDVIGKLITVSPDHPRQSYAE